MKRAPLLAAAFGLGAIVLAGCAVRGLPGADDGAPTPVSPVPTSSTVPADEPTPLPRPVPPPPKGAVDPVREVGRVRIPAIGVDETVWYGVSAPTIDRGVAWWPGTAEFGHLGNVVLAGHRTDRPRPFYAVDRLEPGDEILLESEGRVHTYEVTESFIVDPSALWIVGQTRAHTLTLFSCHPLFSEAQRIVVRARLVSTPVDQ